MAKTARHIQIKKMPDTLNSRSIKSMLWKSTKDWYKNLR